MNGGAETISAPSPLDERFRNVGQGLGTTRAIFAALYEAGRPLSRAEFVEELARRLDAVSLAYIRRVYLHRIGRGRDRNQRLSSRGEAGHVPPREDSVPAPDERRELQHYLTDNLKGMVRTGTLAHDGNIDPDKRRYWPTAKPPRYKLEPEGPMVPYTPEVHFRGLRIEEVNTALAVANVDHESWRRFAATLTTEHLAVLLARLAAVHAGAGLQHLGHTFRARAHRFRDRPPLSQRAILRALAEELAARPS